MARNSIVAEADELETLLHGSPGGTRKDAPEEFDPSTGLSPTDGRA